MIASESTPAREDEASEQAFSASQSTVFPWLQRRAVKPPAEVQPTAAAESSVILFSSDMEKPVSQLSEAIAPLPALEREEEEIIRVQETRPVEEETPQEVEETGAKTPSPSVFRSQSKMARVPTANLQPEALQQWARDLLCLINNPLVLASFCVHPVYPSVSDKFRVFAEFSYEHTNKGLRL